MLGIRSLLFVPAEERRLAKIGKTNADAYIIDLEDSIAPEDKKEALNRTVAFLNTCDTDNLFVRVNRATYETELNALDQFQVGFMLPKIERESDYGAAEGILKNHKIIALIETAAGVMNSNSIASIPWVTALAFGAEDFTVATNISNETESLFVPKSMIALAAKANQKRVYDTPCFHIKDMDVLGSELQQAMKLGYDGKLAIHPRQIDSINETFKLLNPEFMRRVIKIYESSGNAVCEIDGKAYEKLHIDRFKRMLAQEEFRKEVQ